MKKAYARLAGVLMFSLAAAAHAGALVQLTDQQMDTVTAGGAKATTALQTSALGRNTALQTSVATIATDSPYGSLAQTRTAVLVTGTDNASAATNVTNRSAASGHGTAEVATASSVGLASGDIATVRSVDVTTAISGSGRSGHSSIGIANSLADVTTFSVSGKSH